MNKASQVYKKIKNIRTDKAMKMLGDEFLNRKPMKGLGIPYKKVLYSFEKLSGILDPKANKMAADLWTPDGSNLLPFVGDHIMRVVYALAPKDSVKQVVLIGSTTGLQYTSTSDVDVNIVLEPPSLVEELWEKRRGFNEKNIPGTSHPLNIYLQAMQEEIPGYQDSYFGVYDVMNDNWLIHPPDAESIRRPEDKFWAELITARMLANEFIRRADNYEKSLNDKEKIDASSCMCSPWKSATIEHRIERDLNELLSFVDEIQEGRNFAYSWGWGVPRVGYRNVLYKFIHKRLPEKYKIILEDVEEIAHEPDI